jgi:hypothetical protein
MKKCELYSTTGQLIGSGELSDDAQGIVWDNKSFVATPESLANSDEETPLKYEEVEFVQLDDSEISAVSNIKETNKTGHRTE